MDEQADRPGALRRNRPFRLLWTARSISFLGSAVGQVGLLLHLAGTATAVLSVTLLMLVGDLAPALLAPLTGVLADRLDRKRLMLVLEAGQAAATAAIAVWLPALPLLLALFLVRAVLGQIFQPASRAAVPALVRDADLPAANAALGFGENGLAVAGPLLAAVLVPLTGIRGLLLVDTATFLLSAALLTALPRLRPAAPDDAVGDGAGEPERSFLLHAADGLRFLWRTTGVRLVFLSFAAVVLCNAVDDIALVFLAKGPLHGGDPAVALLLGGSAAGLLAGFALTARLGRRIPAPALLITGYAVGSLGNLLTGAAWAVTAALALQAVRGLGLAAQDVAAATLVQRAVPADHQGRAFGNLYGAIGLAAGLSYLLGGALLHLAGPRPTLLAAGIGGLLATAATAVRLRRESV